MSQALYRKYRSRSFDEIAGQQHVTATLASALKQGKISHAYLLTGPRGTGKTSIARILAYAINKLPYSDKPHLDIIEIDAASNRRIEDVRDLREKVHLAPTSAPYKVYIIDEVHMLTTESFNALLKTLEEPPAHVVFILATTELHKLPATITSRAQRFAFRAPTVEDIVKQLRFIAEKEAITIDDAALQLLAEHADGSFRDSISLLDQMSSSFAAGHTITEADVSGLLGLPPAETMHALLEAALTGNPEAVVEKLRELEQTGVAPAAIALGLIKRAMVQAATNSLAAQLLQLLIEVPRSAHPSAKLLAELLAVAHQAAPTGSKKPQSKALQATVEDVVVAESLPKQKQSVSKTKPANAAAKVAEPAITTPATAAPAETGAVSLALIASEWGTILAKVKAHSPPLFGALKTAEVRVENNSLVLAFKFGLHRNRVNDSKHKSVLSSIIADVTAQHGIAIETIVDATSTPTPAKPTPKTPEAEAIINLMGGGEMVVL